MARAPHVGPPLTFLTEAISEKRKRNEDEPEKKGKKAVASSATSQNETRGDVASCPRTRWGKGVSQSEGKEVVSSRRGRLRERDTGGDCNKGDEG